MTVTVGSWVETVLGRAEHDIPTDDPLSTLATHRILVTGAEGSIGTALVDLIGPHRALLTTDLADMDVRRPSHTWATMQRFRPTVVFHLAGAKHAPEGERDPHGVAVTNINGTRNVLDGWPDAKMVLASTCKAANPETAYGASKLIAERMVLNEGGGIARFFNVVESSGNVFETWRGCGGPDGPVPVTPCSRYFISFREAVALLLWTAVWPSGRYAVTAKQRSMQSVAESLGLQTYRVPARRGDRLNEPQHATGEWTNPTGLENVVNVQSNHDPA